MVTWKALGIVLALTTASSALAADSMTEKRSIMERMNAQIARHSEMSKEAILAELSESIEQKKAVMPDHAAQLEGQLSALADMDKDALLALEQAQVQQMVSSGIFPRTLEDIGLIGCGAGRYFFRLPFDLVLDVIFLPVDLLYMAFGSET